MQTLQMVLDNGEIARFNGLMEDSYRKVYNMAYRLAGNRPDAEDLTQEAYFRAFRSFREYEGDRPFENWIFRIVTRLFLDMLRTRRRRVTAVSYDTPLTGSNGDENLFFDKADDCPSPEQAMLDSSFSEDVETVLMSLTDEQRTLVTLADIEKVSYTDIAEMLDKPVGTIRSRLHRTHKLMRMRLNKMKDVKAGAPIRKKVKMAPATA